MLVNSSKAAKLLGISSRRVRMLLAKGRIEGAYKVYHSWLIRFCNGKPAIGEGSRGP